MAVQEKNLVIAPIKEHTHTFICLHGRDSDAPEFAAELFESQAENHLTLPELLPHVKWVFPQSASRTSARFETVMSQWFDVWSVEEPEQRQELQLNGLMESVAFILEIIRQESLPPEKIILGGISQGCAVSILTLLCSGMRLGGFVGLCGWLPLRENLDEMHQLKDDNAAVVRKLRTLLNLDGETLTVSEAALDTPVFLSHCVDDDIVPIISGQKLRSSLEQLGLKVTWKTYENGGHWINEPYGVKDIIQFLSADVGVALGPIRWLHLCRVWAL